MKNLNLIAPFCKTSYGYVACYLNKAIQELGSVVSLWPLGGLDPEPQFYDSINLGINNSRFYVRENPCLRIYHQNSLDQFVGSERIGFPIFELNKFNAIETHHLKNVDRIFVCSKWAESVVKDQTGRNSQVIPLGVDNTIFTPRKNDRQTTVFFTCGKWEKRKGHELIPALFKKAFTDKDSVELWMMCDSPFYNEEERNVWKNNARYFVPEVKFINQTATQADTAYIMQQTDCGLFPSRAEGWGLPILEMMACGKDVIVTNYSGQTQFCNSENAMLVDVKNTEVARDMKWFQQGEGEWAIIEEDQIDQMIEYMRSVHKKKQDGKLEMNEKGILTANQFSWLNSAKQLLEVL